MNQIKEIDCSKIHIGKSNIRTSSITEGLDLLVQSIQKYGLLEPIIVLKTPKNILREIDTRDFVITGVNIITKPKPKTTKKAKIIKKPKTGKMN